MDRHRTHPSPDTRVGAAANYYNSTSPIPVPGATVLTASSPHTDLGGNSQPGRPGQNHPASVIGSLPTAPAGIHPPPHHGEQQKQTPPPPPLLTHHSPLPTTTLQDLSAVRAGAEFALNEYSSLQRRRKDGDIEVEAAFNEQSDVVTAELRRLRAHVKGMASLARQHRWRRLLIGGIVGILIPAVRRLLRRPGSIDDGTVNDTEYAFFHSKSLIQRVLDSVRGGWSGISRLASATSLVFGVLYVFQNEVTLRVANTLGKRLKKLAARIEGNQYYEMSERDIALLRGWRWRVLARS